MCDFRIPPNRVFNKKTKEWKDISIIGHAVSKSEIENPVFGLYHIGASGCGYSFYDGNEWSSIDSVIPVEVWGEQKYFHIDSETEKYRFQRPIEFNYVSSVSSTWQYGN